MSKAPFSTVIEVAHRLRKTLSVRTHCLFGPCLGCNRVKYPHQTEFWGAYLDNRASFRVDHSCFPTRGPSTTGARCLPRAGSSRRCVALMGAR